MKLIVCLDNNGGMLFGGRRQSKDRFLREDMLRMTCAGILWMDEYSFHQFTESAGHVRVDNDYVAKAGPEDFCFVEKADILPYADQVTGVILYKWNRDYPRDVSFPMDVFSSKWRLVSQEDFSGFSHDTITREVYTL